MLQIVFSCAFDVGERAAFVSVSMRSIFIVHLELSTNSNIIREYSLFRYFPHKNNKHKETEQLSSNLGRC